MQSTLLKLLLLATAAALLSSCATGVADSIRVPPPENPRLEQVRNNIDFYRGQQARWGGIIVEVSNLAEQTRIEIVARNLIGYGRPEHSDQSDGRFIAIIDGFVDPEVLSPKREITVRGNVVELIKGRIGDFEYTYPGIDVEHYQLWPTATNATYPDFPTYADRYYFDSAFYYDPWYQHGFRHRLHYRYRHHSAEPY